VDTAKSFSFLFLHSKMAIHFVILPFIKEKYRFEFRMEIFNNNSIYYWHGKNEIILCGNSGYVLDTSNEHGAKWKNC
jgi:hypothetical protein